MMLSSGNNESARATPNGKKKKLKNRVSLTKREKEILELVAQGLTANETAAHLSVSLDTVETHRKNIIKKLNARNTANAVAKAMRKGILS